MYWPNGRTTLLRNTGYTNNGTIYSADGSTWLLRNSGYSNDRQRYGLPVETYDDLDVTVRGRLTAEDGVVATVESVHSVKLISGMQCFVINHAIAQR